MLESNYFGEVSQHICKKSKSMNCLKKKSNESRKRSLTKPLTDTKTDKGTPCPLCDIDKDNPEYQDLTYFHSKSIQADQPGLIDSFSEDNQNVNFLG